MVYCYLSCEPYGSVTLQLTNLVYFCSRLGSLTRLQAAKELFNAFVTRTQAYRLHHSFGLTLFSSDVSVKLQITKNSEEFEVINANLHTCTWMGYCSSIGYASNYIASFEYFHR